MQTQEKEHFSKIKSRKEIEDSLKWHVEAFYASFEAWELDFQKYAKPPCFADLAALKGTFHQGVDQIKKALDLAFFYERALDKLYTFAHLKHDEDISAPPAKIAFEKIRSLFTEFHTKRAFIEPEVLSLDQATFERHLASTALASYRFYLENIHRLRLHTLSADKEALLAMSKKVLGGAAKIFSAIHNVDFKFTDATDEKGTILPLTHGLYALYLRSPDRTLRRSAFANLHGQYLTYENTLAETLSNTVEAHIFQSKARGYTSSRAAALHPWAIDEGVYTNLIDTVRAHLPLLHRYVALKKRWLGLDTMHLYDMYASPAHLEDPTFSKEQAVELVLEATQPLGKDYVSVLKDGLTKKRWVDWPESVGKRSGAYSSGCYDSDPYILMNYRGTLRDLFTLAHEAGHSMHSYLSKKNQPYVYYRYPIFLAEIASTVNEELLAHRLIGSSLDRKQKLVLLHQRIEDIRATLFRQTAFAEFESHIHSSLEQGIPLTPQSLKASYMDLCQAYYGPAFTYDELLSIEWARIPHFYYNFYVYQYATGIALAIAMAKRTLTGDAAFYLQFLSSGGSAYPLDLIQKAGFDIRQSTPIKEALTQFGLLVDEFEKCIN